MLFAGLGRSVLGKTVPSGLLLLISQQDRDSDKEQDSDKGSESRESLGG